MEEERDDKIGFLDISLIKRNNVIIFDQYRKPTFSVRYLNFFAHHPLCQKKGIIFGMVDRIILLLHPQFHQKNFVFLINILLGLDNNYPLNFIFSMIFFMLT